MHSGLSIDLRDRGHGMPAKRAAPYRGAVLHDQRTWKGHGVGNLSGTYVRGESRGTGRIRFDSRRRHKRTLELPLLRTTERSMPPSEDTPFALIVDDDEVFRDPPVHGRWPSATGRPTPCPDGEEALRSSPANAARPGSGRPAHAGEGRSGRGSGVAGGWIRR